jgi:hypothetical protein
VGLDFDYSRMVSTSGSRDAPYLFPLTQVGIKKPTPKPIFWQVTPFVPPDILWTLEKTERAVTMLTPINPELEQHRAENTLRAFTDQENAAHLLGSGRERAVSGDGISITRLFKAIQLNRRSVEPAPQLGYANKQVASDC